MHIFFQKEAIEGLCKRQNRELTVYTLNGLLISKSLLGAFWQRLFRYTEPFASLASVGDQQHYLQQLEQYLSRQKSLNHCIQSLQQLDFPTIYLELTDAQNILLHHLTESLSQDTLKSFT